MSKETELNFSTELLDLLRKYNVRLNVYHYTNPYYNGFGGEDLRIEVESNLKCDVISNDRMNFDLTRNGESITPESDLLKYNHNFKK